MDWFYNFIPKYLISFYFYVKSSHNFYNCFFFCMVLYLFVFLIASLDVKFNHNHLLPFYEIIFVFKFHLYLVFLVIF